MTRSHELHEALRAYSHSVWVKDMDDMLKGAQWSARPGPMGVVINVTLFSGLSKNIMIGKATSSVLFKRIIMVEFYFWIARLVQIV